MEYVSETKTQSVPEQIRIRAEKRQRLIDDGRNPYPISVPITHTLSQVREQYPNLAAGEETEDFVGVAGWCFPAIPVSSAS